MNVLWFVTMELSSAFPVHYPFKDMAYLMMPNRVWHISINSSPLLSNTLVAIFAALG